ncbi:MAG: TIGR02253 family HAD-type hydrolase [Candidatus Aenigmatarchaeota archaeon]
MIKAVLFDLDQTLIDFIGMKKIASKKAAFSMVKAGLKMDRGDAGEMLFDFYIKEGIESNTAFTRFLKKHGSMDHKILAAGINAYTKAKYESMRTYPKARIVLRRLKKKGLKLGIITDAPKLKAWQRLHMMGMEDFFDIVVAFDDTRKKKPHGSPFSVAVTKLKIAPCEILFVGDQPQRDIRGAKKAGMITVLAGYGIQEKFRKHLKRFKPDYTINSLEELVRLIK